MKSYEGFKALTNKPGRSKHYTVLSWSYGLSIASAKMPDLLLLYCWQSRVLSLVFKLLSNCHFSFPSVVFPLAHVRLCAAPTGTSQSRFSPVLVFRQPTYGGARRPRCLCCGRRLCFCSIIGWGGKWKALRSCSPLFLSSCVLTFSPYLSLSPSPCRTTHWVSTRSETEARQDLAAQPGPPTQSRRGTPISTSQPIKVSFATHM